MKQYPQIQMPLSNKGKVAGVHNNFHSKNSKSRNHSLKKIPYYYQSNNEAQSLNSLGLFPRIQKAKQSNNNNVSYSNSTKNNLETSLQKNSIKWHLPANTNNNKNMKKRQKLLTEINNESQQYITGDESFVSLTNKLMATEGDIKDTMIDFKKKIELNKLFIKREIQRKNKENQSSLKKGNQSSLKKGNQSMLKKGIQFSEGQQKEENGSKRKKRVASSRFDSSVYDSVGINVDLMGMNEIGNKNYQKNVRNSHIKETKITTDDTNERYNNNYNGKIVKNKKRSKKRTIQTPKSKLQESLIKIKNSSSERKRKKRMSSNNHNVVINHMNSNYHLVNSNAEDRKRMKTEHVDNKETIAASTNVLPINKINKVKDTNSRKQPNENPPVRREQSLRSLSKRKSQGLFGDLQSILDEKIKEEHQTAINNNLTNSRKNINQKVTGDKSGSSLLEEQEKLRKLLSKLYKQKSLSAHYHNINNSHSTYESLPHHSSFNEHLHNHSASNQLLILQQSMDNLQSSMTSCENKRKKFSKKQTYQDNQLIDNHRNQRFKKQGNGSSNQQWRRLQLQATSQITYRKSSFEQQLNKISQYKERNDASLEKYICFKKQLMKLGFQVNSLKHSQNQQNMKKDNNKNNNKDKQNKNNVDIKDMERRHVSIQGKRDSRKQT